MIDSVTSNQIEFERLYREKYRPLNEEFTRRLYELLTLLLENTGIPIQKIEARTKTIESFLDKVERKSYDNPFEQIKDLTGIRIITYYQDNVNKVSELIRSEFDVDEIHSIDKTMTLGPEEFGYRSVHLVVSLAKSRARLNEWKRFAGLPAEIQVRSVLQHAWAVLSHMIDYKNTSQAPAEFRRKLFRLSAQLESADEEFTTLRNLSKEITEKYRNEVSRGELNLPLNLDSLREFIKQLKENGKLKKWEEFGIRAGMEEPSPKYVGKFDSTLLEILLLTLQTIGISTISEFENLFSGFEKLSNQVQKFVDSVKSKDKTIPAIPIDVLIILASFSRPHCIPLNFDWGGNYKSFVIEALREECKQLSKKS